MINIHHILFLQLYTSSLHLYTYKSFVLCTSLRRASSAITIWDNIILINLGKFLKNMIIIFKNKYKISYINI